VGGGAVSDANRGRYGDGAAVREYLAEPYHLVRRRIAARMVREALAGGPAGPVVELGAGSEGLLDPADRAGRPVVLADLAVAPLRARRDGAAGVCLDVGAGLALRDGCAAALVLAELIEHVYDPRALLGECHRVLRPGGALVLTTPNLAGLQDRWRFLRGRSPRQVDALHPYLRLHIRPFTASSLRALLADAGFRVVELRSNYVGWQWGAGRWVRSRLAARVAPGLGGSLIARAHRDNQPAVG
jgi:SAM-dependent methyltransferase